jgi:hypothetical protein
MDYQEANAVWVDAFQRLGVSDGFLYAEMAATHEAMVTMPVGMTGNFPPGATAHIEK